MSNLANLSLSFAQLSPSLFFVNDILQFVHILQNAVYNILYAHAQVVHILQSTTQCVHMDILQVVHILQYTTQCININIL